jgi:hypothetical protein
MLSHRKSFRYVENEVMRSVDKIACASTSNRFKAQFAKKIANLIYGRQYIQLNFYHL